MNIESTNNVKINSLELNTKATTESVKPNSGITPDFTSSSDETRQAIDKATGLLQTIVTDKLSDEVIRKMPTDEYLKLLSLLDEMISGSVNKQV